MSTNYVSSNYVNTLCQQIMSTNSASTNYVSTNYVNKFCVNKFCQQIMSANYVDNLCVNKLYQQILSTNYVNKLCLQIMSTNRREQPTKQPRIAQGSSKNPKSPQNCTDSCCLQENVQMPSAPTSVYLIHVTVKAPSSNLD